jgi:hypothetical protein
MPFAISQNMKKIMLFSAFVFSLIVITACIQTAAPPQQASNVAVQEPQAKPAEQPSQETQPVKVIAPEVQEAISKSARIKSLRYSYKGPETKEFSYIFLVKGTKIKYSVYPTYKVIDVDADSYDTIYIDTTSKTAQAYCDNRQCKAKGKKADLDYGKYYIKTPLDWVNSIESANKISEQLIQSRNTLKILTNDGTMWVDNYYGVPLQVESSGNIYEFQKMVVNDVKDEEVIPS